MSERGQSLVASQANLDLMQCAVCTEVWTSPQTLQCGHTFCAGCLVLVDTCPLCRAPIETRSITCHALRDLACLLLKEQEVLRQNIMKDGRAKQARIELPTAESMCDYALRVDEKVAHEAAQHIVQHHLKEALDAGHESCLDDCRCESRGRAIMWPKPALIFSLPPKRAARALEIMRLKGFKVEAVGTNKTRAGVKTFVQTGWSISLK